MPRSEMKVYDKRRSARMTGIETQGELAGEIVCPIIYLWNLAAGGVRANASGKIEHNAEVWVERKCTSTLGEVLYKVRSKERPRLRGWVTELFVNFENA